MSESKQRGRPKGSKNQAKMVKEVDNCECEDKVEGKEIKPISEEEIVVEPNENERKVVSGKEWAANMTEEEFVKTWKGKFPHSDTIPCLSEWLYRPNLSYKTTSQINPSKG